MLIWGTKGYVTRIAALFTICGFCRHEGAQVIDEIKRKFTLFFIPLFTTSTKYVQQCTMCGQQSLVTKEFADAAAAQRAVGARGEDSLIQLPVTPEELAGGGQRQIQVQTLARCTTCGGQGGTPQNRCPACGGVGRIPARQTIDVPIPAGSSLGARVRLEGRGEVGPNGGPAGDLYIELVEATDSASRSFAPPG